MKRMITYLAAGLISAHISGAEAEGQGVLRGQVLDDATDMPISGVQIELLSSAGRSVQSTLSNEDGRFRFGHLSSSAYQLRATRIGYQGVTGSRIGMFSGDTLEVELRMSMTVILMAPVEVVAGRPRHINPRLAAYFDRKERAIGGTFISREEIQIQSPRHIGHVLVNNGLALRGGRLVLRRNLARGCEVVVYIDGNAVSGPGRSAMDALELVHPSDVEGVEIYRGASSLPPEFSGSTGGCGAVAIWLRR